jgi:hypothetical protein
VTYFLQLEHKKTKLCLCQQQFKTSWFKVEW